MVAGHSPEAIVEFGLNTGDAVSLRLGSAVPAAAAAAVEAAASALRAGRISIPDTYDGPEFEPEAVRCDG